MFSFKFRSIAISVVLCSLALSPMIALAQSEAPVEPDRECENAGGVWDDGVTCAPCNLCLTGDGEVIDDTTVGCEMSCDPWCTCPEGLVFAYTGCVEPEGYLSLCRGETPEAMMCVESGGSLVDCVDTCTYCLSDSGERVMTSDGCPEVCEYGCNCPEGQSFSEEGCKPDAEVLPSCDDDIRNGGEEREVADSDSCQQLGGRAPLWLMALGLLITVARRRSHGAG